jgi:predicted dithiol-disulfide oxidoreductase (DUF899 family)
MAIRPERKVTRADLFDGRSQLFIKHFILAPGQVTQCVGAPSNWTISKARSNACKTTMSPTPLWHARRSRKLRPSVTDGLRFRWVSSCNSDFNYDFNVSFTPEQIATGRAFYNYEYVDPRLEDLHGDSVFFKDDADQIFHTYSTFGRGGEEFLGTYSISM